MITRFGQTSVKWEATLLIGLSPPSVLVVYLIAVTKYLMERNVWSKEIQSIMMENTW